MAAYLHSTQPHICLYRDGVEIILTQSRAEAVIPNRMLHGYGYDAYVYTEDPASLYRELIHADVTIAVPLHETDYHNREFVLEDIDGRWIAFGIKTDGEVEDPPGTGC